MVTKWSLFRLGDVCTKIGSGATPRGGSEVYLETGPFTLIRSQNVYNDGFHHDGLAYISGEHAAELVNVEVLSDDILLNITGDSVARACQVDSRVLPARVNQHVAIIRPDRDKLDSRFLRYFLVSPEMQAKLLSWAGSGGTRNALTKSMIESFDVYAPENIDEQRAIARILGTLDDKIELNRRTNETLEAMARALFKSWFVDFDPVRVKAEGRDPGLPKEIADLFPDRFVDSELGEIPEGWKIKSIGDLADVVGGTTPSTKVSEYWEEGTYAWATPKDLSELSVPVLLNTERRITGAGLSQIGSGLLSKGTVLLSSRAPIGYLAVAEIPVAINQGFIAMMPKAGTSSISLLLWANAAHEEIVSRANGSTFLEISKANFRPIPVVTPSTGVMRSFEKQVRFLYERIVTCARESHTLSSLRDTLLPKLISGDLRVRDAEKIAESA
ncbi:MAG TPA: restriction endonuclease subunit S [Deltaproteobacteria bacterium]|nr:restriction endonuclease subunit S [Deltaproteobacteria bacterium]